MELASENTFNLSIKFRNFIIQITEDGNKRDASVDDLVKIIEEMSRIH